MEKPSEEYIENYVRYPSDLSTEEILWIEEWIQKDCEVRLLVDWFRKFYETVDQVERSKTSSPDKPHHIQLKKFDEGKSDSKGIFSETPELTGEEPNLKTIRIFFSEEHKTFVRILHDKDNNRSKLHVMSEFVDSDDVVLIKIPGEDILLVSELGGTVRIPKKIPLNKIKRWGNCKLYLPITKIHVYRDTRTNHINIDSLDAGRDKSRIDLKALNHEIEISIELPDKTSPQKMVLQSNKESNLWALENGVCLIPINDVSTSGSNLFFFQ